MDDLRAMRNNRIAFHLKRALLFAMAAAWLWFILEMIAHAQPVTSDDWVRLVVELQSKQEQFDNDDRKFLARMINILTANEHVLPDAPQRKWLLDIERRLKNRR